MTRHHDLARVKSTLIRRLADWWHGHSGLPDRVDFDPAQWRASLPYLLIAEGGSDPFRIRYRLVGSGCVYAAGFDFTGQYLDEMLEGDRAEDWVGHYRAAFETRRAVYGTATVATVLGDPFTYEFAIFPVRAGGEGVAQFIGLEDYGQLQPRLQSTLLDLTLRRRASE